MMGWTGDNGDPDNFFATLFSCAASEQGSNYSKWCYKPFEDLIQPARATDDHNKRVELYKASAGGDARSGSGTDHRSLHRV